MLSALLLFFAVYASMLSLPKYRPCIALCGGAVFIFLGSLGVYELTVPQALAAVDWNVLLMIAGTMGLVTLFIDSGMPARLAEQLIARAPNVKWAVTALALFAGVISAFVDNVATVLMVAPVGLVLARKLKISPVPVLISIAVSSNLQGAATLVGDTTSMLLGGFAGMSFPDFFWMQGKPGIFWGVELGALASCGVLLYLLRSQTQVVKTAPVTRVSDYFPTALLLGCVGLLIACSFLSPPRDPAFAWIYNMRCGLTCCAVCCVGVVRACVKAASCAPLRHVWQELDRETLLLLLGLFVIIRGITAAGVIDAVSSAFYRLAGDNAFALYTLIVLFSVALSAFIDNIPYVAAMLPVVQGIAALMNGGAGACPYVFYFGLLTGATLGGNLTPIGASANIAAIGILRKNGETVGLGDFLRIGIPFTFAAVLAGYLYIWVVWG